jgi:type I restriction enzyme S subunit
VRRQETIRLGEACEKIGSGATPRGGNSVYRDAGIVLIRSQNVYNDGFHRDGLAFITDEHANELSNVEVQAGDVLLNITGDSVARVCQVPDDVLPARVNQHVAIIRPVADKLDARYLRYFLTSPATQDYMLALASAGATRKALTKGMIEDFEIPAPPLPEQRAIAGVLGALDDKIELNRRMNETLEALAQAEFGKVKDKGGKASTLGELAAIQGGKQLPTEECLPSGSYTVFGANGIMGYAERATHTEFVIAFGRVGAYCGSIHWSYSGAWINNNASSVVPHRWPEFVLQAMLNVDFPAMRTGSAQPFIPNSALASAEIERPPDEVLDEYCSFVRPLHLKQDILEKESRTLAALRDALLPKLLSGAVRVRRGEVDTVDGSGQSWTKENSE